MPQYQNPEHDLDQNPTEADRNQVLVGVPLAAVYDRCTSMNCSHCGMVNFRDARFCQHCGRSVMRSCSECGVVGPVDASFCQACGHRLNTSNASFPDVRAQLMPATLVSRVEEGLRASERRQITVLFADIVGFTSLSEKLDPEDVRDIMGEVFMALATELYKWGAYIEKFIGDAIVAIFGAPVAHGDDAVRACSAALAMQRILRERQGSLQLRIGINSGLAVTGPVGDGSQYGATGDTVNIAARFEQNAPPGSILVSASTERLARGSLSFRSVEPLQLKGKGKPAAAFEVFPDSGTSAVRDARHFVGRQRELQEMGDSLEEAIAGNTQLLRIVGEPGIGKSALLSTFLSEAAVRARVYHTSCRAENQEAYSLIRDLLSATFFPDYAPHISRHDQFTARLADLDLQGHEGLLGSLLDLPYDDPYRHSQGRPVFIRRAMRDLIVGLASEGTIVLAIEDVHWIDPDSLDILGFLISQIERAPLLITLTGRDDHASLPAIGARYRQLSLRRLDRDEATQVTETLLPDPPLPSAILNFIVQRAEGVPLFLEEIVNWLLDRGLLLLHDGHWELAVDSTLHMPDSIQAVVMERLDNLNAETRQVLQVASVIGREFDMDLLETVVGRPSLAAILTAEKAELVEERVNSNRGSIAFQFRHALMQQAAYDTLLNKRRAELHAATARAIEEHDEARLDLLAFHWRRAGDVAQALRCAVGAGRNASERFALGEAEGHFTSAIEFARADQTFAATSILVELYEERGVVRIGRGAVEDALGDFARMLELTVSTGDVEAQGRAHARLGQVYWILHQPAKAVGHGEAALSLAGDSSNPQLLRVVADAMTDIGQVQGHLGETTASRLSVEEGLRLSRSTNHELGVAQAQGYLAILDEWQGRFADCIARSPEAIEAAVAVRDPYRVLYNRWIYGLGLTGAGRFDEAVLTFQDVNRQAHELGNSMMVVRSLNALGWVHHDLYDPERVMQLSRPALEIAQDNNLYEPIANSRINLAEGYVALGELEAARRMAIATIDLLEKDPWMWWRWKTRLTHVLAEIELHHGKFDEALVHVQEGLEIARTRASRRHSAKSLLLQGRCLAGMGDIDGALAALGSSIQVAEEIDNPPCRWIAHYWMARTLRRAGNASCADHLKATASLISSVANDLPTGPLRARFLASTPILQMLSTEIHLT